MQPDSLCLDLPDEPASAGLAQRLFALLCPEAGAPQSHCASARIHLRGELGAGKTTLARALLRAAGVRGRIKSPSYALLESYKLSNLYCYHFDFYRFEHSEEWLDLGFDELFDTQSIILIEWPEKAGARLPPPDLDILLLYHESGRRALISAGSPKGQQWLERLKTTPAA